MNARIWGLWRRRPTTSAAIFFVALASLFYAPLLLGVRTFPEGDFTHHFLPFSLFQRSELAALRLPVWNPYTYAGHPFLADIQAAVFYPLSNLLLAFTLPWDDAGARLYFLQVEAVAHVALAGFFTYLLLVDLTNVRWAALLAGVAFAFSGYLTGYPPLQLAILRTAIWLPLLLLALRRAAVGPRHLRWWILSAILLVVAFLGGHPQTFLHLAYSAVAWLILMQFTAGRSRSSFLTLILGLWLFLFLSFGLAAAQLLPSLEFTRLSVRANTEYSFVSGGFPLQDAWQIVAPGVFSHFSPLYVGAIALGLAVTAVVYWLMSRTAGLNAPIAFFSALTLIALLLSFGDNGFLYPLFYRFVPGWDLFRGQERAAFLVAFALSALAGLGAATTPTALQSARRRAALIYGALVTASVYAFGLLWQLQSRTAVSHGVYLVIALFTLLFAVTTALLIWLPGWSYRRSAWLIGLTFVNLALVNAPTNLDNFSPESKTRLAPELAALSTAVAERSDANLGLAGRVFNEFRVYDDYGMTLGVEDVWGSSPLRLAAYARFFENFPLDRLWRLTGVEHVITWRRELFEPAELLADFPQATDTTYLHRLSEANPRAWLAAAVRIVGDAEAAQLLADHNFDLENTALLTAEGADAASLLGNERADASEGTQRTPAIHLQRLAYNRLAVEVTAPYSGVLVLAENWMPGWRIERLQSRNGTHQQPFFTVLRANLAFLGIPLPAGVHSFQLVYQPESVRLGLWISAVTLAILVSGILVRQIMGWLRRGNGASP